MFGNYLFKDNVLVLSIVGFIAITSQLGDFGKSAIFFPKMWSKSKKWVLIGSKILVGGFAFLHKQIKTSPFIHGFNETTVNLSIKFWGGIRGFFCCKCRQVINQCSFNCAYHLKIHRCMYIIYWEILKIGCFYREHHRCSLYIYIYYIIYIYEYIYELYIHELYIYKYIYMYIVSELSVGYHCSHNWYYHFSKASSFSKAKGLEDLQASNKHGNLRVFEHPLMPPDSLKKDSRPW